MIFPLEELAKFKGGMYAITVAASRRAYQLAKLAMIEDPAVSELVEDNDGKLIWKCPQCGNTDQSTMNVTRRTCGYIGTQYWNQGRTQEIKERVLHL